MPAAVCPADSTMPMASATACARLGGSDRCGGGVPAVDGGRRGGIGERQERRIRFLQFCQSDGLIDDPADGSIVQQVGGGARGAPVDLHAHGKIAAALRHVLMDGVVGEARERARSGGQDHLGIRRPRQVRARRPPPDRRCPGCARVQSGISAPDLDAAGNARGWRRGRCPSPAPAGPCRSWARPTGSNAPVRRWLRRRSRTPSRCRCSWGSSACGRACRGGSPSRSRSRTGSCSACRRSTSSGWSPCRWPCSTGAEDFFERLLARVAG